MGTVGGLCSAMSAAHSWDHVGAWLFPSGDVLLGTYECRKSVCRVTEFWESCCAKFTFCFCQKRMGWAEERGWRHA